MEGNVSIIVLKDLQDEMEKKKLSRFKGGKKEDKEDKKEDMKSDMEEPLHMRIMRLKNG